MNQDRLFGSSSNSQLTIRGYSTSDRQDFIALNLDWIEEYFSVEDSDREQLEKLESSILNAGGRIVVAELDGCIVGVGAIRPPHYDPCDNRRWLEIIKMATCKYHRGKGIGRAVLQALVAEAGAMQANAIWLETNEVLTSAIRLYERCGFRYLSSDDWWPTPYERCNVQMVLQI